MPHKKLFLSPPHMGGKEREFVGRAFDSNWISPYGQNIVELEEILARYYSVPSVLLVNSGTAAIHLCLKVAGVGPGDKVIVPTLNFAGCINPILYCGAEPILIDSEPSTWNIDPALAGKAIADQERQGTPVSALLAVHLFGHPANIGQLASLCAGYGIPLLEDAADAIGTSILGRMAGSWGQMGAISFNGNKVITTSGGGLFISHNPEDVEKARYLANQAMSNKPYYLHNQVGYNYMLSNVLAGIGLGQMEVLGERLRRRAEIGMLYREMLAHIPFLSFPEFDKGMVANNWLTTMLLRSDSPISRDTLITALAIRNIESRPVWRPMHLQPAYRRHKCYGGEVAEDLARRGICLPSGTAMDDNDVERVAEIIQSLFTS